MLYRFATALLTLVTGACFLVGMFSEDYTLRYEGLLTFIVLGSALVFVGGWHLYSKR